MILKNAKIVLEDKTIENGWLEIVDKKIVKINSGSTDQEGIDLKGNWVLPGFIDVHVHGGYGVDFETNGDVESFVKFGQNVVQEGVTKYVQASVTNSVEKLEELYKNFGTFMQEHNHGKQAVCLGAHVEGPFISPEKKGAHDPNFLMKPDIELTKKLQELSNNHILIMTYAPELQDGSYTKWLIENKILPSAGHSIITAKDFEKEYQLGIHHVTHLFNAMSGFDQHRPGLAVAAFNHPDLIAEVISDGIHIQPELLKTIYDHKGPEGIVIITDAMNAKGLADGNYKLGPLDVVKKGMEVRLASTNNLAGAGATYDHNVRFFHQVNQFDMQALIKMTSINAAKQLNVFDQTGSIAENKLADLVVLDPELHVQMTICEGEVSYENPKK